jgi:hypothetical protein
MSSRYKKGSVVKSEPPSGKQKITNFYYNPETGGIEIEVSS